VSSNPYTPRARTLASVALCLGLILPLATPVAPATANGCDPTLYDANGKGGQEEPAIAIASVGHLLHLAVTPADWGKSFVQTAAIDLAGCTWTPIGNSDDEFTGDYDGAGLAITGLSVDLSTHRRVGMFGFVGESGSLSRVRLVGVEVAGQSSVGGLAGRNDGTISDSSVSGTVRAGQDQVGGLVGLNRGTITRSSASGAVTGDKQVGGLVGTSDGDEGQGAIIESFATGAVTGSDRVGGLVGLLTNGARIEFSYATGDVAGSTYGAGGLVGQAEGEASIADSYATGDVTSTGYRVGGLAGYSIGDVIRSYALGTVVGGAGELRTGRLVGEYEGSELGDATALGHGDLPLVGVLGTFATVENSVLRTSAELKAIATFRDDLFWSIVEGWAEFDPDATPAAIWGICESANGGYPFLLWQFTASDDPCGGGGGTVTTDGGTASTPVLTGGTAPTVPAGQGVWQRSNGSSIPLAPSSPAARQLRYTAPGLTVTLTGGPGTSATNGLVASPNGTIDCEVCTTLATGGVIEAWMFSTPRLVAAHRIEDLPCQTFAIPVGAPLDGAGPLPAGAHTLQLALPTASGMQAVNVGVTVGGPVPASVPAGEGSVPFGAVLLALLAAAGAVVAGRKLVTAG
jgi:hypothetical protein